MIQNHHCRSRLRMLILGCICLLGVGLYSASKFGRVGVERASQPQTVLKQAPKANTTPPLEAAQSSSDIPAVDPYDLAQTPPVGVTSGTDYEFRLNSVFLEWLGLNQSEVAEMHAAYNDAISQMQEFERRNIRLVSIDEKLEVIILQVPAMGEALDESVRAKFAAILGPKRAPRFFKEFSYRAEQKAYTRGFGKYPLTIKVTPTHSGNSDVEFSCIDPLRPPEWGNFRFKETIGMVGKEFETGRYARLFQIEGTGRKKTTE
jgi:hypothetical protein